MARRTLVIVTGMLAMLTGLVAPALAQYPPGSTLGVSCTPEDPEPGETVECSAGDCDPGTDAVVSVSVGSQEVMLAGAVLVPSGGGMLASGHEKTITTDQNGQINFAFVVPEDADAGDEIQVSVECEDGGTASVLAVQLEVQELADTGTDSGLLLVVGVVVLAIGGLIVVLARRRDDHGAEAA